MKLVVDLLACQTSSRFRDVGRYTHSLVTSMAQSRGLHQMIVLANAQYADGFESLRRDFLPLLPRGAFLPYQQLEISKTDEETSLQYAAASTLVNQAYEMLQADCVLYPNIFEGWGESGVAPLPDGAIPSALKTAIIHDFLPYQYAEHDLEPDPHVRWDYMRRFEALKNFDLLLAVSEATRQDAIQLFDFSPERVVNLSAAPSAIFHKKTCTSQQTEAIYHRFGITKPFIFCPGSENHHQNVTGTLQGYAQLPEAIRAAHQLVLTSKDTNFQNRLEEYGLASLDVIVTGHVSDQDLVDLYNLCQLCVFPSYDAGSGMPILEAMACGAPVIAAATPATLEILAREDALFDPTDVDAVTTAFQNMLTSDTLREELSAYGLARAEEFSWEKSAQRVWQALDDLQKDTPAARSARLVLPPNQAKLRVAYVSPLPPQKSGIADYSADLLPALGQTVDLDVFVEPDVDVSGEVVQTIRSVYPTTELVKRQDQYDVVMYQFGNSKAHRHMYALLKTVPGVVVLHDFYLGHLREFLHSTHYFENPREDFLADVGNSHGMFAMIDMIQRGLHKAIWDWPVNWDVLKLARKLIVHSGYQNELLEKYYGNGWHPRATVIPQVHKLQARTSADERAAWREKLDLAPDQFVVCSFGFITATKLPLRIVEAFARLAAVDESARLVFVGEIDHSEGDDVLANLIERYALADRVKVTGFVDNETYQGYLCAADAAIQLRVNSRGETSRAVLDCLAYGLPTIINAHGSLNDYPETDVMKLAEQPGIDELAQAMTRLRQDAGFRAQLSTNARAAIENRHHPEKAAAAYYETIVAVAQTSDKAIFRPLIDALATQNDEAQLAQAAHLAAEHWNLRAQPRLLIDVTNISVFDLRTGIQRVVKNLIKGLYKVASPSLQVELIRISDGTLYRSGRFAEKLFSLPENSLGADPQIEIKPGDTLFMLDTAWNLYEQYVDVFVSLRKAGGRIYTMLYDLIPVNFPQVCTQDTIDSFVRWIDRAIVENDELVCISKAVATEAQAYIRHRFPESARVCRLSYIHLGSDIPVVPEETDVRPAVHQLTNSPVPFFLMVSTIEPRKGFDLAIDAFEQLWRQGHNLRLCLIGKIGWNVEKLERRIRSHPELGRRLFFIESATDAEVNQCYAAATALIAASLTEGFGLPIVEAARYHVPVIASDIPVFREVGRDGPEYFALGDPTPLAEAVIRVANKSAAERRAMADRVPILTWEQSAEWMLAILNGKEGRHPADKQAGRDALQTTALAMPGSKAPRASKIWLYAPEITSAEMADFQKRLRFYLPGIYQLSLLNDNNLHQPADDDHAVLQFCQADRLPAALSTLGRRIFWVDHRHNDQDADEWARFSAYVSEEVDLHAAHEQFLQVYQRLKAKSISRAYLFGTGPSLARAMERNWRDGYRIVCNTIVRDPDLWWHLQPHFIVAADSRYHFGHTEFARAFRADLQQRLRETETYFLYPRVFDAIVRRELPDLHDQLLPLPYGPEKRIDVDLSEHYETPSLGNVLPLMLLPLGCTFSKHVCLWGFDGRGPTDSLFWKNSNQHNYPELMHTLMEAHPAFFESHMPKPGENTYVDKYMGDALDQLLRAAEARGFTFEMLHSTWTETLQKRIKDPSIPHIPTQH